MLCKTISEIITEKQLKFQQQDIEMRRYANSIGLKRGGLVRLEATFSNRELKGQLRWLLTPRLLKRLTK